MKKIFVILSVLTIVLASCENNKKFKVQGVVENAQGKMLVLEHTGIVKTQGIDSMKILASGKYTLKAMRPEYPDFYRLRIENKTIAFAIDSTETVTINANLNNFATDYTIEGSYDSELIKELRLSVINIQNMINSLKPEMEQDERMKKVDEIEEELEKHKANARKIIMQKPVSTAAYFALYQQINGQYIFSPYLQEDYPYWAATGTAYHTFMPKYDRSKNIYNFVLGALKEKQAAKQQEALNQLLQNPTAGYIDIVLPDRKGQEKKLSELEGKVILIDFSTYEAPESIEYTFSLRDLYNKYNKRGFEIYQVSLDRNKLLWEISIENIPWACVRDENGPSNRFALLYNVSKIPTTFLMNKKGDIVARDLNFGQLDKEIDKLLKSK
ncbi:AhpC/TSA family protein [Paludibacter sp. 221]|uniref:TlpA disulfide reductase family protein n=1 Tax=Paludibacter sp. 221 TaxID=2302939 RepID=UPI0013D72022|nr:TlpA disulfide reductase family protein [Paludibacter sp. 221]NDV45584.1 AhpC/TSA family protein [Paludibacter sp. 221]